MKRYDPLYENAYGETEGDGMHETPEGKYVNHADHLAVLASLKDSLRWRKYPEEKPKSGEYVIRLWDTTDGRQTAQSILYSDEERDQRDWGMMGVYRWLPIPPIPPREDA